MKLTMEDIIRIICIIKFILSKIAAIALIVIGFHFMDAHMSKVLPFGITSSNIGLWGLWAYTGWLIAGLMIVGGMYLFFKELVDYWI